MSLPSFLSGMSFFVPQTDDDLSDQLHYYYTSTLLMVLAGATAAKLLAGRPIECWVPYEYKLGWQDYAEMYCWARNTYFVPFDSSIPTDEDERDAHQVSYYQWTPFFLLVCAFAFYFPCILWRAMNDKSGIRLRDIISIAQDKANIQPAAREANIQGLAVHLLSIFRHQFSLRPGKRHGNLMGDRSPQQPTRGKHTIARWLNWRYYEAYMALTYLGIKILYLANVTVQLFLMNSFLQTDDYGVYGFGVLYDLLKGREWQISGNFPRVTLCDFHIRVMGNVQRHTVQCVLVINIFTEKLFILLWLWYSVLIALTLASCAYWAVTSFSPKHRYRFVGRRLEMADTEFDLSDNSDDVARFTHDLVKTDGVFVLRMIAVHAGAMFVTELVDAMWDIYVAEQRGEPELPPGLLAPLPEEHGKHDGSEVETGGGLDVPHAGGVRLPRPAGRPILRRKNSVFVPLMLGAAAAAAVPAAAAQQNCSAGKEPATAPVFLRQPMFQTQRSRHNTLLERRLAKMAEQNE